MSNWNVSDQISVYCIGCGNKSPSQIMPTPLCPFCCVSEKWILYMKEIAKAGYGDGEKRSVESKTPDSVFTTEELLARAERNCALLVDANCILRQIIKTHEDWLEKRRDDLALQRPCAPEMAAIEARLEEIGK